MTTTIQAPRLSLPHYGIRDDERTKPGVILVDWSGDEATIVSAEPPAETLEFLPDADVYAAVDDDELDVDPYDPFTPRWHGIGRRPGAIALSVLLGFCLAIGIAALFAPSDAQAGAPSAGTDIALR